MDAVDLKQAFIVRAVEIGRVVSISSSPALGLANRQGSIKIPVVLCDQVSILYAAPRCCSGLFSYALRRLHGLSRFISRLGNFDVADGLLNVLRVDPSSVRGLRYFASFDTSWIDSTTLARASLWMLL